MNKEKNLKKGKEKKEYNVNIEDIYIQECNCGNRIRHNNGGNYHKVIQLITVDEIPVCVRETNTRELNRNDKKELSFIDSENPEEGIHFLKRLKATDKLHMLRSRFDLKEYY